MKARSEIANERCGPLNSDELRSERRFETPLFEVVAEIHLDPSDLVELPARSYYSSLDGKYPQVQRMPLVLVSDPAHATNPFAPAYRFFNEDQTLIVQIGPRLIALNAVMAKIPWPGWAYFKDRFPEVFHPYVALNQDAPVLRFSLSFYNRIALDDLGELTEIFAMNEVPSPANALDLDYSYKFSTPSEVGTITRHYLIMPPDAAAPCPYLAVNTIARHELHSMRLEDAFKQWQDWVETAHRICKDTFYNSLSKRSRVSWDENSSRNRQEL